MRKRKLREEIGRLQRELYTTREAAHANQIKAARAEGELVGIRYAFRSLADEAARAARTRDQARAGEPFHG